MKRVTKVSRAERIILLVLASTLLIGVVVALGLDIAEEVRLREFHERYPNFAVDAPRTSLALLNLIAIPLFFSVVFARRYLVSGVLTLVYALLGSLGIYWRLDGKGFLGGEGFYQDPFTEILAKAHWFELLLPIFLTAILAVHIRIHLKARRHSEVQGNLP